MSELLKPAGRAALAAGMPGPQEAQALTATQMNARLAGTDEPEKAPGSSSGKARSERLQARDHHGGHALAAAAQADARIAANAVDRAIRDDSLSPRAAMDAAAGNTNLPASVSTNSTGGTPASTSANPAWAVTQLDAAAAIQGQVPAGRAEPAAPGPAPVQATLPTPVLSPEFQAALGAQVTVLAKGGVERAELQLNPAEMGPISIRIELDGNGANVQFGAESAVTRGILEQGLPALAAALSEAGLTLSGGGVSQHPGSGNPQDRQAETQAFSGDRGGSRGHDGARHDAHAGAGRAQSTGDELNRNPATLARQATRRERGLDVFA